MDDPLSCSFGDEISFELQDPPQVSPNSKAVEARIRQIESTHKKQIQVYKQMNQQHQREIETLKQRYEQLKSVVVSKDRGMARMQEEKACLLAEIKNYQDQESSIQDLVQKLNHELKEKENAYEKQNKQISMLMSYIKSLESKNKEEEFSSTMGSEQSQRARTPPPKNVSAKRGTHSRSPIAKSTRSRIRERQNRSPSPIDNPRSSRTSRESTNRTPSPIANFHSEAKSRRETQNRSPSPLASISKSHYGCEILRWYQNKKGKQEIRMPFLSKTTDNWISTLRSPLQENN